MDKFTGGVTLVVLLACVAALATYTKNVNKVHHYVHPITGCEYLYTTGSPLVPSETGGAGDQYGCRKGQLL